MAANTPPGPAVDASGQAVIDPTANVIALSEAATKRQDDLREMAAKYTELIAQLRAEYDEKLRVAESARIDAIRAVDVGAVAAANQSAETRAVTLATQVATQAEAVRVGLAAALEPIQRDIADLRRVQYEAAGGKETSKERSSSLGLWVGLGIAAIFGLLSFLIAAASLVYAVTRCEGDLMLLSDLATAVRKSGLPVTEVPGWHTRGHGEMGAVKTIVCHHTAGPSTGNYPSLSVVVNGRADLPGPLAHLGLGRDGTVYVIAAGLCYHAGEVRQSDYGNGYSIGIEAEATGVTSWPDVQMDAYARLCKALCEHYGVPVSRVLGHKEVCAPPGRKTDPNFDMAAFRVAVANAEESPVTPEDIEATAKRAAELVLNAKVGNDDTTVKQALNKVLTYVERQK